MEQKYGPSISIHLLVGDGGRIPCIRLIFARSDSSFYRGSLCIEVRGEGTHWQFLHSNPRRLKVFYYLYNDINPLMVEVKLVTKQSNKNDFHSI